MEEVIQEFLPLTLGAIAIALLANAGVRFQSGQSFFPSFLTDNSYVLLTFMAFLEVHTYVNFISAIRMQGDSLASWYPFIGVLKFVAILAFLGQQRAQGKDITLSGLQKHPVLQNIEFLFNGMMIYLAWFVIYSILEVLPAKQDLLPLIGIGSGIALIAHGGVRISQDKSFFFSFLTERSVPLLIMSFLAAYTLQSLRQATNDNQDNIYGLSNLAFHAAGMGFLAHYGVTLQAS